jgi:hypothetical protein
MFVCCDCCVLSGRGLCDGLISRPEESYRLWRVAVCVQETSKTRRLKPATGLWKTTTMGCNARKTNKQPIKRVMGQVIPQKRLRWSRGSVLAIGTHVRGFKPGRSRRIFRAKISSARLPSEGKQSRLSHVVLYGM